ncbi:MAG: MraY family glycosyltransferase, partial [Candidatus Binatia bacterium]
MLTLFAAIQLPSELSAILTADPRLPALCLAVALIVLVGATDDVRSLSPWAKLAVETLAAVIAVSASSFQIPFVTAPWLASAIAIFWIVAVTNAFNLIDGLDGLATGLGIITSATLVCISVYSSNQEAAIPLIILGGALTGFLRYNFFPSKIFLGDSGSLLLGFLLGVVSLSASSRLSAMVAIVVPVLALGLPLVETVLTASRRMLGGLRVVHVDEETGRYFFAFPSRPGLFTADREHIHHRLVDLGFGHRGAVAALYGACLVFCSIAFLLVAFRTPFDAIFVAAFGLTTMIAIRRLNYGEMQLLRNGTLLPIFELPLINRRLLHVLLDLIFIALSYFAAHLIRSEFVWDHALRFQVLFNVPTVVLTQFVVLWAAGLYRGGFRCTG